MKTKQLTPSDQLAQLKLDRIKRRQKMWKDFFEVAPIALVVLLMSIIVIAGFVGGIEYLCERASTTEKLKDFEDRISTVRLQQNELSYRMFGPAPARTLTVTNDNIRGEFYYYNFSTNH